jgi:hypothetical protein
MPGPALTILGVVLVDEDGVAESWSARQGYTHGVGFQCAHSWGNASAAVTAAMAAYSGHSDWVGSRTAGAPPQSLRTSRLGAEAGST